MTESAEQRRKIEQKRLAEAKMDEAIDRTEKMISSVSIGEVTLKLVLTTAKLTDNVNALSDTVGTLTDTVATLTQDVNGGTGVRVEMKDLRHDIKDTDKKIAAVTDKFDAAMTVIWRVIWFLCLVGVIAIISSIRTLGPVLLEGLK